ncbi:MAG: EamA family transporter [Planctomycetes bacterium]|nr:EamA family transporter [Planctomycetota bacterium]
MTWVFLGILSALFLGIYDVCKKQALRENAVLPILFLATVFGFLLCLPIMLMSYFQPQCMDDWGMRVHQVSAVNHGHLLLKACIVDTSWILAYVALKHLPISIVSPIRASGPLWTLFGALLIFHEQLNTMQWIGLGFILVSYYAFSVLGLKEGISFRRNKWVWCIVAATMIGTISSLYDKYLINNLGIEPVTVQAWFSMYLMLIMAVVMLVWYLPRKAELGPFEWRGSIIWIAVLLISADFVYFRALSYEGSLIVILSALRRSSVVISFVVGAHLFSEENKMAKGVALAGVLTGVLCILFAQ